MNRAEIVAALDSKIQQLQEARAAIAGLSLPKRRGQPSASASFAKPARGRVMSAEGRKRIAEAQRKRWAAQKAKSTKSN